MRRLEWDGILYTVVLTEISKHPQQQQLLQALYLTYFLFCGLVVHRSFGYSTHQ